jgi:hypothetical protein
VETGVGCRGSSACGERKDNAGSQATRATLLPNRKLHAREPGDPTIALPPHKGAGRWGKAKAARPRCTVVGSQTAA